MENRLSEEQSLEELVAASATMDPRWLQTHLEHHCRMVRPMESRIAKVKSVSTCLIHSLRWIPGRHQLHVAMPQHRAHQPQPSESKSKQVCHVVVKTARQVFCRGDPPQFRMILPKTLNRPTTRGERQQNFAWPWYCRNQMSNP